MADIPGLVEGASEGVGLGLRFLKHLSRTGVLLHVIDIAPFDGSDPVVSAKAIIQELKTFSDELASKERWLVLNKVDLLPQEDVEATCLSIVEQLDWKGPLFKISALAKVGTEALCRALAERVIPAE